MIKYIIPKIMKKLLNPPSMINCQIHKTSKVCSRSELSNVQMGKYSYIGNSCLVVNTEIGNFCSIADNVRIGGAGHPMQRVSMSPVFHAGRNIMHKHFAEFDEIITPKTAIGNDVWIGMNAIIKAGVSIGNGAIIGMGSVITHDVPPYTVWGGVPGHQINVRFPKELALRINSTEWWNWPDEKISGMAAHFDDPERFLTIIERGKTE